MTITLPQIPFYLFGMGHRRKLLYKAGQLSDALTGETLYAWDIAEEHIDAPAYTVHMKMTNGDPITLYEDERGIAFTRNKITLYLSESPLSLPTFEEHPHQDKLRVLHHEILINVMPHGPVPNFFVYDKPWYRDAAMMAMVLAQTGNVHLLDAWISNLDDPFDHNNGVDEPDNLGQALYLIALTGQKDHPLIPIILKTIPHYVNDCAGGSCICGQTDGQPHPVYQTQWLKFGLQQLGLEDPFVIPYQEDSYATLFWWPWSPDAPAPMEEYIGKPGGYHAQAEHYPYLTWAEAHFLNKPAPNYAGKTYPLTWEAHASQANYEGLRPIGEAFVEQKICAPHTWHAAEMFLYLWSKK